MLPNGNIARLDKVLFVLYAARFHHEGHPMPRGRPTNLPRSAARDAGQKTYLDSANPCWCGCDTRYVANAQCVDCLIAKGKARYAALGDKALATLKRRDHARYLQRCAEKRGPQD